MHPRVPCLHPRHAALELLEEMLAWAERVPIEQIDVDLNVDHGKLVPADEVRGGGPTLRLRLSLLDTLEPHEAILRPGGQVLPGGWCGVQQCRALFRVEALRVKVLHGVVFRAILAVTPIPVRIGCGRAKVLLHATLPHSCNPTLG